MVLFWVKYSLSHAQIGLPFNFNFYLPRSLPVTLIWEPHPSRPSPPPPSPHPRRREEESVMGYGKSFYGEYGLLSTSWSDKLMSRKRNRNRYIVRPCGCDRSTFVSCRGSAPIKPEQALHSSGIGRSHERETQSVSHGFLPVLSGSLKLWLSIVEALGEITY